MSNDVEMFITTEDEIDRGKVTEVEHYDHAIGLYFQEPFSDHELGMIVHHDEIPSYVEGIVKGDDVVVKNWGQALPPASLTVNGVLFYDRTERQRKIIAAVRHRQNEIAALMGEYSKISQDNGPLPHEITIDPTDVVEDFELDEEL